MTQENHSSTQILQRTFDASDDTLKVKGVLTLPNGVTSASASSVDGNVAVMDGTTGKVIRDSGISLASLTGGASTITGSIANNQSSPIDITGAILSPAVVQSAIIDFEIVRATSLSEVVARGQLQALYYVNQLQWVLSTTAFWGDPHGVTFSMAGNQLQYVSNDLAGSGYSGTIRLKISQLT